MLILYSIQPHRLGWAQQAEMSVYIGNTQCQTNSLMLIITFLQFPPFLCNQIEEGRAKGKEPTKQMSHLFRLI